MSWNDTHADGVSVAMAWFIWYTRNACRNHAFHLLFNNPLCAELFGRYKDMIFTNIYSWRIHISLGQWLLMTETKFTWKSTETARALCLKLSSAYVVWQFYSGRKRWAIFWRRLKMHFLDIYCSVYRTSPPGPCILHGSDLTTSSQSPGGDKGISLSCNVYKHWLPGCQCCGQVGKLSEPGA